MTRQAYADQFAAALRPHMPGAKFVSEEVGLINQLAEMAEKRAPKLAVVPPTSLRVSPAGIALIQEFEGYAKKLPDGSVEAYADPGTGGAPWTIGWGSTTDEAGQPIKRGTVWPKERAAARFADHVGEFAEKVWSLVKDVPTTQNQFDALVSFAYNVGADIDADTIAEGLGDSTLLKKHRTGDYAGAQGQFAVWNKAAGKVMPGLTRRRAAEAELYGRGA